MRLEVRAAIGVGPGVPAVSTVKPFDTSTKDSSSSRKRFAQPAIVGHLQGGMHGRPAQIRINHQHSPSHTIR